ncbi:MAG: carboxy-S-adenosyl-L-methionine synthase CmoA [Pseudomonadales bacterium]|nr:carboxy-S-adenosyl-L-methionine synthase CmoA [Pseudomonadales bacterium]
MRDTIYADHLHNIAGFRFDENVAAVFPDMIQRSVPGYSNIITMTGLLAARFAQDHTRCYDLGCSLGASTLAMASALPERPIEFIAVDNSTAMLARCTQALATLSAPVQHQLLCKNLQDIAIENASVAVLNFTLQFVPLSERNNVMRNICNGMHPGGALILSEKICFDDPVMQQLTTELHHDFKKNNGYSALEISQKRSALENVLVPETLAAHEARLRLAGFSSIGVWFQCFNFMSLVAIK